jgi:hypothetical protein
MAFRPLDPKSSASANSATFAWASDSGYQASGLGQKLHQLVDARDARNARRSVATRTGFAFQAQMLAPLLVNLAAAQNMQAGVRVAFHGEQPVFVVQILFVNRNSENAPKHIPILRGKLLFAGMREDDHGGFEMQSLIGEPAQFSRRSGDGLRVKAPGPLVPTQRKNAHVPGAVEPWRQNRRARRRVHGMHKVRALALALDFDSNDHIDSNYRVAPIFASSQENNC